MKQKITYFRSWTSFDFKSYDIWYINLCMSSAGGLWFGRLHVRGEHQAASNWILLLLHHSDLLSGRCPAAFACCNSALTLQTKTNGYLLLLDTWSRRRANGGAAPVPRTHADWFRHCFQTKLAGLFIKGWHCRRNAGQQEIWGSFWGRNTQIAELCLIGFLLPCRLKFDET